MADTPQWRQGYDAVERELAPRLNALIRSDQFAVAAGVAARLQRAMQEQAGRVTRRMLHSLNLPAGSDVTRILNELGQLKRQVRALTVELEAARESSVEKPAAAKPSRPRASRSA